MEIDREDIKQIRHMRIKKSLDKDLKPLLLYPVLFTLAIRFLPERIKPFLKNEGKFDLSSHSVSIYSDSYLDFRSETYFIAFLVFTVLMGILAYKFIEIAGFEDEEKDFNPSLNLKASDNRLKIFFDTLFGRHQIFKNSNRNWPELQAAFSLVSIIYLGAIMIQFTWLFLFMLTDYNKPFIYFLSEAISNFGTYSELAVKLPAATLSLYFAIYVYVKKDYGEKWKYCGDSYNKLIATNRDVDLSTKCILAIDILYLDLWAKRGFCKFFRDTLIDVVNTRTDWNTERKISILKKMDDHDLYAYQAEEILEHGLKIKGAIYFQMQFPLK